LGALPWAGAACDHQQHACLGIIEVKSACNVNCPLCLANAGAGFNLSLEEVEEILDDFVRAEGHPSCLRSCGRLTGWPRVAAPCSSYSFHPGEIVLSERLGTLLGLGPRFQGLDVAARRSTSAIHLVQRFGCSYVSPAPAGPLGPLMNVSSTAS
jgi:hypothetical protein